jgi:hypothetical protein
MTAAGGITRWQAMSYRMGPAMSRAGMALRSWVGRPWQERGTQTYVAIVSVTSLWAATASDRLAVAALRHASTNLNGLAHQPGAVLVSSAMWMEPGGWRSYLSFIAVALMTLAPFERRLGTGRWLAAFGAGHVGATLLTAVGQWVAVETGWLDPSLTRVVDVGWSYGALAVATAGSFTLPRTAGRWWAAVVVGSCLLQLVRGPSFNAVGHVLAAAIGLAVGLLLVRDGSGRQPQRGP